MLLTLMEKPGCTLEGSPNAVALVLDLIVGEAEWGHSGEDVGAITAGVACLRRGRAVVPKPIGLDDQA